MLESYKKSLTEQLKVSVETIGYEMVDVDWRQVPFSGKLGLSTTLCFRLAAQEKEWGILKGTVKDRAKELAEELSGKLQEQNMPGDVVAENGYLNFYFDLSKLAVQLVETVIEEGEEYGQGPKKPQRVMVEYSQPNTHKGFHVGHFRNVCLGHSVALIARKAGYDVVTANYLGDIGMHVIKCLWGYLKYYAGQEPDEGRGRWLGEIYAEADDRIELRYYAVDTIRQTIGTYPHLVTKLDNFITQLIPGSEQQQVFTRARLHYALDPNWQNAVDTADGGIDLKNLGSSEVVPDGGPGNVYHKRLRESLEGQTPEAMQRYINRILDESSRAVAVQLYVPAIWSEASRWISAIVDAAQETLAGILADEEVQEKLGDKIQALLKGFLDGEYLLPSQVTDVKKKKVPEVVLHIQSLSRARDLLAKYQGLDAKMDWWPETDIGDVETKDLFQRWEGKDPDLLKIWEETRAWSLDEFQAIYDHVGAEFQVWFYESQVEEEGKEIVDDMIEKGLAEDQRPDGPVLIHIDKLLEERGVEEEKEYRTLLILRSDGTSLYSTKDLSLAKRKFEDYGIDYSIYVVDARQKFYFEQVFKALELWGFEQAKDCYHLAYEMVTLPSGTMSSRAGNIVLLEDFLAEAKNRALEVVREKNPSLTEQEMAHIAEVVSVGSTKYVMLSVDNNRVITFDWETALSFEGKSAPYIQYSHARACRLREKAGDILTVTPDFGYLNKDSVSEIEIDLLEKIGEFPEVVQVAAQHYKPHMVANYVYDLATTFNTFYHTCDVLRGDEPDAVKAARLSLADVARQVLGNGLALLGIQAPTVM
jgi:arginyl-tRNA synthetase